MPHDYDDTDLTREEMLALAARSFDTADTAVPIPAEPIPTNGLTEEDLEDLALSRSEVFNEILRRSQKSLERKGGVPSDEVRRRLGL